jgi:hypothetical protein
VRARPWLIGLAVYLVCLPLFIWWLKKPPRIQPPLATIPLPDGTELRWVGHRQGPSIYFHGYHTFENRVRLDDHIGYYGGWHLNGKTPETAWLAFSRFHPQAQRFSAPDKWIIEVVEDGSPFTLQPEPRDHSGPSEWPYEVYQFPVIPRSTPKIRLRALRDVKTNMMAEVVIPNPFYTTERSQLTASPMPQRKEVGGFVVDLERVTLGKSSRTIRGVTTERPIAQPVIRVSHPNARSGTFHYETEWFDGTGNSTESGMLPVSEPVWGLRVRVTEGGGFPFPADRITSLGTVTVPGMGQALQLKVPPELLKDNVTEVLLIGPGSYTWSDKQLLDVGTPNGVPKPLLQLRHKVAFHHQFTLNGWNLCVMSSQRSGPPGEPPTFRMRNGTEVFELRQYMTSNFGYTSMRSFDLEGTGQKAINAGTSVQVEMTYLKTYVAKFFIQRPEFGKK